MSVTLRRHAGLESVAVEALTGVDGQGKPAYGTALTGLGMVMRERQVVRVASGEEVEIVAAVYVNGDEFSPMAAENDRVTLAEDGFVGIVVKRVDVPQLQTGELDHVELHLREE